MTGQPKISILIAVYNGENVLQRSIHSLQNQTLKEIEIVCVNDFSTDGSAELIASIAEKDPRVRLISFDRNRGTVCARKAGVEAAAGEYIMFMDQDDIYEPYACEELYEMIWTKEVDIVHFRSRVIAIPPTTDKQREWQENFMKPFDGYVFGKNVFDYCFRPDSKGKRTWGYYTWNLWNKIYRADVCKRAMCECREDYVINGDDIYVYMLIAYYAQSYFGDANGKFYHIYSYGSGLMGRHLLTLKKFYTICCRINSIKNEYHFFQDKEGQYENVLRLDYCRCIQGIVERWYSRMTPEEQPKGFDMMLQFLPASDVLAAIEKHVHIPYDDLLDAVRGADSLQYSGRNCKTIGIYFSSRKSKESSISSELGSKWLSQGYEIICFCQESERIDIPFGKTVYLPHEELPAFYERKLEKRLKVLQETIDNYKIDVFIYTGKKEKNFIFDLLTVKSQGTVLVLDACELPSYLDVNNSDAYGYYAYCKMLQFSDAVLVNDRSFISKLDIGINFICTDEIDSLFSKITAKKESMTDLSSCKQCAMLPMIQKYGKNLEVLIHDGRIKRAMKLEAIYEKFREENLFGKVKLLVKLLLRCIGIRKNFHEEAYNQYKTLERLANQMKKLH